MGNTRYRSRESQEELKDHILDDPEEGWKVFLSEYGPLIHSLIRNFGLGKEDHDEVFQEVSHVLVKDNCRAIRNWEFDKGSLPTYISVIAVRTVISYTKSPFFKNSTEFHSHDDSDIDATSLISFWERTTLTPRDRLHRIHLSERVQEMLHYMLDKGSISEEDYKLLTLRLHGLAYKEIEDILGISVETLTSRFCRLKPVLKNALKNLAITSADMFGG